MITGANGDLREAGQKSRQLAVIVNVEWRRGGHRGRVKDLRSKSGDGAAEIWAPRL